MPLMSSLYTGVSGLQSSQVGINTTAHNLANVYTEGYVRQQISFADTTYMKVGVSAVNTKQIGLGVIANSTRHIRDLLLDKSYRQEVGRENYYSANYEAVEEIETIMGELEGIAFQDALKELKEALNEMSKTPDSTVARAGLVMCADEFITKVTLVTEQLQSYQARLDQKVSDTVDRINQLGDIIVDLNLKINSIEAPGVEAANDFRDLRDNALDELSKLIYISYEEDQYGQVTVRAEGEEFVTKGGCFHMSVAQLNIEDGSGYLTPVWPQLENSKVFILNTEISTSKNNDIGLLKGLLAARGDHIATYDEIPHEPIKPQKEDFTLPDGTYDEASYKAAIKDYWEIDYAAYEASAIEYNKTIGNSIVMTTQAVYDQLINGIVTMINDALSPNTATTIPAGTTLTIPAGVAFGSLDDSVKAAMSGLYTLDDKGKITSDVTFTLASDIAVQVLDKENASYTTDGAQGIELFVRKDTSSRYTELTASDGTVFYVYNPYNDLGFEGSYTASNVEVNPLVKDDYSLLPFSDSEGANYLKLAESIIKKWDTPTTNLDPNNLTPKDFDDYYTGLIGIISNKGYLFKSIAETQRVTANFINSSRQSITGVSSEEELSNLLKFQNAYGANSRYINAVAEMIDTLINRVGVH